MTKNVPFYASGLSFSCTRCSTCCRYESGYVFLSETDVSRLAAECKLTIDQFITTYCRWIPSASKFERLSLKEKANLDCIFWNSGCQVYDSRPLQCKSFPFWPDTLALKESWERTGASCPGIDRGKLFSMDEIEALLKQQKSEPAIIRNQGRL
jgi:Fe-S-cluster containining protein